MDHLNFKGKLMTADKIALIEQMMSNSARRNGLFCPPARWYAQPLSDKQLKQVVTVLCRWTGIKPHNLEVRYSSDIHETAGRYFEDSSGHHLLINLSFAENSYQTVAVIAHELIHFIVSHRWRITFDEPADLEEFVDLAGIYLGFGAIILNGISWPVYLIDRFYGRRVLSLGMTDASTYARELGHYSAGNPQINESLLYGQLTKRSRRLFSGRKTILTLPAAHIRLAEQRILKSNLLSVGAISLLLMAAGGVWYTFSQHTARPSLTVINQHEQATLLYDDYLLCQRTVANRQRNMPQADILQQQSINADAVRCQSLLNQYNAQAAAYNR